MDGWIKLPDMWAQVSQITYVQWYNQKTWIYFIGGSYVNTVEPLDKVMKLIADARPKYGSEEC